MLGLLCFVLDQIDKKGKSLSRWELCRDVKELKNIRRFKLALEAKLAVRSLATPLRMFDGMDEEEALKKKEERAQLSKIFTWRTGVSIGGRGALVDGADNTFFWKAICKAIHSYAKQVVELDQLLRKMVFESLGVEKYHDGHIESGDYRYRVQKYFVPGHPNETKHILRSLLPQYPIGIINSRKSNVSFAIQGLAAAIVGLTTEAAQHLEVQVFFPLVLLLGLLMLLSLCCRGFNKSFSDDGGFGGGVATSLPMQ
ncbi:hypothetical protein IFM89_022417 [Coptis chinensis]|uniref:Uncharacterized protein n=1 Tax=Coptis chinensis TaxID=261450 RepID=A0A835I731_9MAGN|nr:hypothetical protein IFM89_022417 [Coptis chinensis]